VVERPRQMEDLVINPDFWDGRRVFLTGHTGFKGAWLSLLLKSFGAEVLGFARAPRTERDIFCAAGVLDDVRQRIGDISDLSGLCDAIREANPDVVIHMAAQSLVRPSYADPVETYATNVMGTVHLLEAVRQVPGIRAVVVVTSDKCYENVGQLRGYRETDSLGGHDPYSSSKGCAEIVASAYRRSFFAAATGTHVATVRAGNVIGGGDWAQDRLVPDAIRAFAADKPLLIRNPRAVRPWQHVLDPVAAYLLLAERLVTDGVAFAEGWNFGPATASEVTVERVADGLAGGWGGNAGWKSDGGKHPHEAAYLRLDCTKAAERLAWYPLVNLERSLELTVDWYKAQQRGADMRALSLHQIQTVLSGDLQDERRAASNSSPDGRRTKSI
jgi:CDP-glucose 4,6-dehydratase